MTLPDRNREKNISIKKASQDKYCYFHFLKERFKKQWKK